MKWYNMVIVCALITTQITNTKDRRCHLYDLSKLPKNERVARSPVIQFYSSVHNIGNYMPLLGMQEMLGMETDVWCMHDKNIDFDYINANYSCAIIGGAGLLNSCFEPFWKKLDARCKLPMIMWGLGICLPYRKGDKARGVSKSIVKRVAKKCDLINVRDHLTADYYELDQADISPCPTVVYLQKFKPQVSPEGLTIYSAHMISVGDKKTKRIKSKLQKFVSKLSIIDNIQRANWGLEDIILKSYCKSSLVITSRLHGAIMAYAFGIPCIMIPGDKKLDSFHQTYGYGMIIKNIDACKEAISQYDSSQDISLDLEPVKAFGKRAREWVLAH